MTTHLQYGATAKLFHWLIVALLLIQFLLGWFMPSIHGGMQPGTAMALHLSFGITILANHTLDLVALSLATPKHH